MAEIAISSALAGSPRRGGYMRKRPGLVKRGQHWHIDKYLGGKRVARSLETTEAEKAARLYDKICAEAWDQKHLGKEPERLWEEAALLYVKKAEAEIQAGKRKTLDDYRLGWLNKKLEGVPLTTISKKYVRKLLAGMPSPRHYSALVSAVLTAAVDEELMPSAPRVMMAGISNPRNRHLSEDEAVKLVGQGDYLTDAILFSLATGLRRANVMGLRWEWIRDRAVYIPEGEFKQGREHVMPLNRTAMECVKRQLGKHDSLVFTHAGRELVNPKAWESKWNITRKGITDFRWHDIRHTWATWLVQAGVPEAIVETLGGWQSGKMVRRYTHASVEFLRPSAEAIDPLLERIFTQATRGAGKAVSSIAM